MNSIQLEKRIDYVRKHLNYLESLLEPSDKNKILLKKLLHSSKWPNAVNPKLLCNPNSDIDKIERSQGILENIIDRRLSTNDSILDFGCGEGHLVWSTMDLYPKISVGYDIIPQGWCRFPQKENLILTSHWDDVEAHAPYDVILLYDVLDHIESPLDALTKIQNVLSSDGRIYIRCHPWTARHGAHGCNYLNKAYAHLVFSEEDLRDFGWDGIKTNKILDPITTYRNWFDEMDFHIVFEKILKEEVEKHFTLLPLLSQKFVGLEEIMKISFVNYVLEKKHAKLGR